jgi:hypothetical protein
VNDESMAASATNANHDPGIGLGRGVRRWADSVHRGSCSTMRVFGLQGDQRGTSAGHRIGDPKGLESGARAFDHGRPGIGLRAVGMQLLVERGVAEKLMSVGSSHLRQVFDEQRIGPRRRSGSALRPPYRSSRRSTRTRVAVINRPQRREGTLGPPRTGRGWAGIRSGPPPESRPRNPLQKSRQTRREDQPIIPHSVGRCTTTVTGWELVTRITMRGSVGIWTYLIR